MATNVGISALRSGLSRSLGGAGKTRQRPVRRRGRGFFGNVWNGIKKAANWVKDKKLISRGLNLIPHPGAKAAGAIAGSLGLGRRKRRVVRRKRRQGGSIVGALKKAHAYVRSKRLISSALKHFKYTKAGNVAHALGYGKMRRKRRVVRRRRQGGSIASFVKKAHSYIKSKRLVSSALRHFAPKSNLHKAAHALGYGRIPRRRIRRRRC